MERHDAQRNTNTAAGGRMIVALALVLVGTGCQQARQVGNFGKNMVDFFSGETPINAAKKMEDRYFPDERRVGVAKLADRDFGRRMPYTERYQQIAQFDSDWLVRATAVRALNRSRDRSASQLYVTALGDPNDIVRVEAAKALNNMPDPAAQPALLKIVSNSDENRDARIWAADALKHYKNLEVARTLATQLSARDFGVAWQARKSLQTITGQDHRYDEAAWLQYLTGPDKPFG